jgi:hypothetical protein
MSCVCVECGRILVLLDPDSHHSMAIHANPHPEHWNFPCLFLKIHVPTSSKSRLLFSFRYIFYSFFLFDILPFLVPYIPSLHCWWPYQTSYKSCPCPFLPFFTRVKGPNMPSVRPRFGIHEKPGSKNTRTSKNILLRLRTCTFSAQW